MALINGDNAIFGHQYRPCIVGAGVMAKEKVM